MFTFLMHLMSTNPSHGPEMLGFLFDLALFVIGACLVVDYIRNSRR